MRAPACAVPTDARSASTTREAQSPSRSPSLKDPRAKVCISHDRLSIYSDSRSAATCGAKAANAACSPSGRRRVIDGAGWVGEAQLVLTPSLPYRATGEFLSLDAIRKRHSLGWLARSRKYLAALMRRDSLVRVAGSSITGRVETNTTYHRYHRLHAFWWRPSRYHSR
jgi:hypothetical protein